MAREIDRGIESDAAAWRAIGRLEGDLSGLREDVRELGRRVDRLFYAVIGMGGALLATILATRYFGT